MIGDLTDMWGRLRSLLAASWFSPQSLGITPIGSTSELTDLQDGGDLTGAGVQGPPILNAVLQAPSTALAFIYALLTYVRLQTRIRTATGGWLDLIAFDFFGASFARTPGQTDAAFATAIIAQIFLIRNTRPSIVNALESLTGVPPVIFEPWRIPDCGAFNATLYYGAFGLWGSRSAPFDVFITAFTGTSGVANAQVYAALEAIRAAGVSFWVLILPGGTPGGSLDFSIPGNPLFEAV